MMPRRLDHHFMGAQSIHFIVNAISLSVQLSFYPEGGEFIGNDSKCPARTVRRSSIVSECNDLRRGFILISFAKRAESTDRSSFFCNEIRGPSSPLCGDAHT